MEETKMLNKKLQKLLEELGAAAAEPVATEEKEPKTLSVKVDNDSVYPADEHKQSEDVTPVVVESLGDAAAEPVATEEKTPKGLKVAINNDTIYTADKHMQSDDVTPVLVEASVLSRLLTANGFDTRKYTLSYLAERFNAKELLSESTGEKFYLIEKGLGNKLAKGAAALALGAGALTTGITGVQNQRELTNLQNIVKNQQAEAEQSRATVEPTRAALTNAIVTGDKNLRADREEFNTSVKSDIIKKAEADYEKYLARGVVPPNWTKEYAINYLKKDYTDKFNKVFDSSNSNHKINKNDLGSIPYNVSNDLASHDYFKDKDDIMLTGQKPRYGYTIDGVSNEFGFSDDTKDKFKRATRIGRGEEIDAQKESDEYLKAINKSKHDALVAGGGLSGTQGAAGELARRQRNKK
jgi:hypothetical protein